MDTFIHIFVIKHTGKSIIPECILKIILWVLSNQSQEGKASLRGPSIGISCNSL